MHSPGTPSTPRPEFVALIPAKPPRVGKRRLAAVPPGFRTALATAFALDTLHAVHACGSITTTWLVSSDLDLAAAANRLGIRSMTDPAVEPAEPGAGPTAGDFNAMLRAVVCRLAVRPDTAVVVVPADLPAMTSTDLDEGLRYWDGAGAAFVADAHETGTTVYLARAGRFDPRYGPGSRMAHLAAGARELPVRRAGLHQDVDDVPDLDAAIGLGVGTHTRAVLARLGRED
ncbi:MAG: 2-phospho-L-lactate guanylyltransferase [Nocardioides sp.]